MGYRFARWIINLLFRLIAHVQVHGDTPSSGPEGMIIVSNHVGRLDAALFYYLVDHKNVAMLVAEKYRNYAIYRWFVKQLDAMWIDRYNADLVALRGVLNRLHKGAVLVMAPEGTRSKTGVLNKAHPGASYLAAKSGALILPVALVGTEDKLVVAQLKRLKRLDIHVYVGEPFRLPGLERNDREALLQKYTDEMMCRIAALLPAQMRGAYADYPRLKELIQEKDGASV
jgi:1-acyl-sn-glycerol-3-phosphate acyltransferase